VSTLFFSQPRWAKATVGLLAAPEVGALALG